tara:strand:- start:15144 stop:16259 length:1116 start_codon:yes stop_codon:yes gene_type:complete
MINIPILLTPLASGYFIQNGGANKENKQNKQNNYGGLMEVIQSHIGNSTSSLSFQTFAEDKHLKQTVKPLFNQENNSNPNVTFIAPEWNNKLQINGLNISDFVNKYTAISQWIFVLVPFTFHLGYFFKDIKGINKYDVFQQGKLLIITIKSNLSFRKSLPQFNLEDTKGKTMSNKDYEIDEQILLYKWVSKDDSVLQLGGNIGTSCILVDKIPSRNKKSINVCVEPNGALIPLLEKNKNKNKANFVIIDGAVSKNKDMMLVESDDVNKWGSVTVDKNNKTKIQTKATKVKTYDFDDLNKKYKFTVLFADCEGCLEPFLKDYPHALKHIKKVIFEKDQEETCDYDFVTKKLHEAGFYHHEGTFHQVYIHNSV